MQDLMANIGYLGDAVLGSGWVVTAWKSGRSELKNETISTQRELIEAQTRRINLLVEQNAAQQVQIDTLKVKLEVLDEFFQRHAIVVPPSALPNLPRA